jgi:hypothetical protein
MIGKDNSKIGVERCKIAKVQNGTKRTIKGKIKIIGWHDTMTLIIIDELQCIHFQTISGHIHSTILSSHKSAIQSKIGLEKHESANDDIPKRKFIIDTDISAENACITHDNTKITVLDTRYYTTLINTIDWNHSKGFGHMISKKIANIHEGMNSIASFTYQNEVFYCITNNKENHVRIVSERGNIEMNIGFNGKRPRQFSDPVCCACHVPIIFRQLEKSKETCLPNWYLGVDYPTEGVKELMKEDPYIGKFYVILRDYRKDHLYKYSEDNYYDAKELESMDVYDLYYLIDDVRLTIGHSIILAIPNEVNEEDSRVGGDDRIHQTLIDDCFFQLANVEDFKPFGKKFNSISRLLKKQKICEKVFDRRPYVLLAIGEKGNNRVQIMRYFWMRSALFKPSVDVLYIFGGSKKRIIELINPVSLSFSPDGDFVIVDSFLKKVYLFTPLFNLVKVISVALVYSINRYVPEVDYRERKLKGVNIYGCILPVYRYIHV